MTSSSAVKNARSRAFVFCRGGHWPRVIALLSLGSQLLVGSAVGLLSMPGQGASQAWGEVSSAHAQAAPKASASAGTFEAGASSPASAKTKSSTAPASSPPKGSVAPQPAAPAGQPGAPKPAAVQPTAVQPAAVQPTAVQPTAGQQPAAPSPGAPASGSRAPGAPVPGAQPAGKVPATGKGGAGQPAAGGPAATPAGTPAGTPAATPAVSGNTATSPGGMDAATYVVRLRDLESQVEELKEQVRRSHTRLSLLSESVLSAGVGGAQAEIVFRNLMSNAFRVTGVLVVLDGAVQYNEKGDDATHVQQKNTPIFDGAVPPGDHTLQVVVSLQGHGYGVFSYLRGYKFEARSTHSFTVRQGKGLRVEVIAWEKGTATTPLDQRPAVRFVEQSISEDAAASAP